MPLLSFLLVLIAVGVILYLINSYVPMDGTIKKIMNAVVIIVVILWILQLFGILPLVGSLHVGR